MDIYVVLDADGRFVDASARLQGAELIRSKTATKMAEEVFAGPDVQAAAALIYQSMTVKNHELRDVE